MKKIRWRDNGLLLSLGVILIAAVLIGSEIIIDIVVPKNPTLTISIVNENEIDDEETVDDARELADLDKSEIVKIADDIASLKEKDPTFETYQAAYPDASPEVWLQVVKQLRKSKHLKASLIILETLTKNAPEDTKVLFQLARVRSSLDEPDKAISIYQRLLTIQPSHQLSRMNLGLLLVDKKDYLAASEEFTQAIDITSGRRKAKSLAARGSCYIELQKYPEAVFDFEKSIQYRPTDATVWRKLANAQLLNNEDPKLIRETFDRAIALKPDYLAALHERAYLRWASHDFDGARNDLEHVTRVAPDYVASKWTLTYLYLTLDKNQLARKEIIWLGKQGVNEKEQAFLLGLENLSNQEWDLAAEAFDKYQTLKKDSQKATKKESTDAYQIDPWVNYFSSLSDFYREEKQTEQALSKLDALNSHQWLAPISRLQKSYFLNEMENYAGAIAVLTELQQTYPNSPTVSYWMGRNLLSAGDSAKAVDAFKRASKLDKENSQYKLSLALAYSRAGNVQKAVQQYEELLSDHPRHKVGHYNYAVLLSGQGKPEEALRLYERAIELDPEYTRAKHNLALLNKKQKNYAEAIKWFQDLVDEDPTRQTVRLQMAETWLEEGNVDNALGEIDRALTLDSEFTEAHLLKSSIFVEKNDLAAAAKELLSLPDQAFETRKVWVRLYNIGVKAQRESNLTLAETCNDKVLSVNPKFEKALVNQSIIYNRTERPKNTVELLADKATLVKDNPKLVTHLARAYQMLGDKKNIIALLEPLNQSEQLTVEAQEILKAQL